jgi:O-antigen ligase
VQPWDTVSLPGIGALSRIVGVLALGAALVAVIVQGRFLKPGAVFWLAVGFVTSAALTLFWTISIGSTLSRAITYAQLLGSVWIVQEFARRREQRESLLLAFCLGSFVPIVNLFNSYRLGIHVGRFSERVTSTGALRINADNLALTLVIAMPMAWYLVQHRAGIVRLVALVYAGLAPVAVLLTGTRGAFTAGLVSLSIVLVSRSRESVGFLIRATVLLAVVAAAAIQVVPDSMWNRVLSIQSDIANGQMSGREDIWAAGVQVFVNRPLLGVGAAAFMDAVNPILGKPQAPHNFLLSVLVEQGIVGFCLFAALLVACARTIFRLSSSERTLWMSVMVCWVVGVLSVNFEESKVTWLLFGLVAAQTASERARRPLLSKEPLVVDDYSDSLALHNMARMPRIQ